MNAGRSKIKRACLFEVKMVVDVIRQVVTISNPIYHLKNEYKTSNNRNEIIKIETRKHEYSDLTTC